MASAATHVVMGNRGVGEDPCIDDNDPGQGAARRPAMADTVSAGRPRGVPVPPCWRDQVPAPSSPGRPTSSWRLTGVG